MRKEWLLLAGSVTVTVALALVLIRGLAPGLLGVPIDLQVVRVDEEVVPFYENVFRDGDPEDSELLLADPYLGVRARPLVRSRGRVGPNDILGFRNLSVPNSPDVIAIGDSQTYGNNVPLEANWPSRLMRSLAHKNAVVYSMATGGWGAVQYLDMFDKAVAFRPKLVIVAFYTGNDPRESFRVAYSIEKWAWLRPDPELSLADRPAVKYPPPPEERWRPVLPDGTRMAFTPRLRLASNEDHPTVDAGWAIMAAVAERIGARARAEGIRTLFTVLPTKETAYAKRLQRDGVTLDPVYAELVRQERARLETLAEVLKGLEGSVYVDVVAPLQRAVRDGLRAYPKGDDGHPTAAGHAAIAHVLAQAVEPLLPAPPPQVAERP
ncbi:MAG: GDSL-type esterase/lipase family protein [Myxococcota bacterium]